MGMGRGIEIQQEGVIVHRIHLYQHIGAVSENMRPTAPTVRLQCANCTGGEVLGPRVGVLLYSILPY